MGMIIYGTKAFTKLQGYYGEKEHCEICNRTYKKAYVRINRWFHIDEIPLFPVKKIYVKICPICGNGIELKSKQAKQEMMATDNQERQDFEVYAKHILANKPKGIMAVDTSYEAWVKDLVSGEEICIGSGLTKDSIKRMKKERGLKKLEIIDVQ